MLSMQTALQMTFIKKTSAYKQYVFDKYPIFRYSPVYLCVVCLSAEYWELESAFWICFLSCEMYIHSANLDIDVTHVLVIELQGGNNPLISHSNSVNWLLVIWWCQQPGPWYQKCFPDIQGSSRVLDGCTWLKDVVAWSCYEIIFSYIISLHYTMLVTNCRCIILTISLSVFHISAQIPAHRG